MAGNGVVLKPASLTPLIGQRIQEIFERAGFPQGFLQTVHGGGAVGQALVESSASKIFFTGSVEPLREARPLEDLLDPLPDQGCRGSGLQHHAVAGHERDRDLAERDRPRVVPRGDRAHDSERLVAEGRSSSASASAAGT